MTGSSPALTGTLLLDVNDNQTVSVATGTNVDTVLLTAGKLADKDGKAQTVTIADFKTDNATDTIVVNGANDLIISKLTGNGDETVVATAHTGKLTINNFTNATKVFSGSNDDTFVSATPGSKLEISSGAGNDTVDLGRSTAANIINLGEGDDTITVGATVAAVRGANEITLGAGKDTVVFVAGDAASKASIIKDAVIGEDKIILTGAANNTAALNIAALGTITAGLYDKFGNAHAFTLTGSTASDLSNLVQFGKQAVAATATTAAVAAVEYTADDYAFTAGSADDQITTGSADVNAGAGNDVITTGKVTGTITGGAGSDTFKIGHSATIADLGATDILKVTADVAVAVDVVESFTATAATTNASANVTLNLKDGVNVDMTLATLAAAGNGYTIDATAAVTTGATIVGSRGNDTITGSKFADTITGGEGSDTIDAGAGADTIILTESVSATDKVIIVATTSDITAMNTIVDFTGGTNELKTGTLSLVYTNLEATDFDTGNATLADAVAAVFAHADLAVAADSATFTYADKVYLVEEIAGNGVFDAGTDIIVEVTGYTGTILAADIIA